LRSLRPEHFMEATCQGTQRTITLASLALVRARRRDVHVFNELLVQYPRKGRPKLGQVVPDNMIVLTEEKILAGTSYNVPLEPAPPFVVFEYVSTNNPRKDYEESFRKYERELKVPYYAIFYPETEDLTLYRHNRRKYVTVKPNMHGRFAIPELKLELDILDGWMRFWWQGELLPLPADLQRKLDEALRRAEEEKRRADELQRRLEVLERENAELRARLSRK